MDTERVLKQALGYYLEDTRSDTKSIAHQAQTRQNSPHI